MEQTKEDKAMNQMLGRVILMESNLTSFRAHYLMKNADGLSKTLTEFMDNFEQFTAEFNEMYDVLKVAKVE